MQILIPDTWLREFIQTDASVKQIQQALSLCGPSVEKLHLSDRENIYDIEVTTNRVDCMSVFGIAREAMAILPQFKHTVKLVSDPFHSQPQLTQSSVSYLNVKLNPKLCDNFSALLIKNVQVSKSPEWMAHKLNLVGIRPINNIVDITNYVMHEMGQPIHAFDYDKISKSTMLLRESKKGEKLTTLDGKIHVLLGGDIVIEDGSGNLIDLCGIMGGENSQIDNSTKNVLVFVQTYESSHIRHTSMSLAVRTTAAVLFEKGMPTQAVLPTLQRTKDLITQIAGGTPEKYILEIEPSKTPSITINLLNPVSEIISKKLGINLDFETASKILSSLGFKTNSPTSIKVPWFRALDVSIPEDLVEEVARIYGYHNLPNIIMSGAIPHTFHTSEFYWVSKIKTALKYWGFTETYTYSLVSDSNGLKLKNPLSSEWAYLRTSLIPSHLQVVSENYGRVKTLLLFEVANVYLPKDASLPDEQQTLCLTTTDLDIYKLKGIIESLLNEIGIENHNYHIENHPQSLNCEINLSELLPLAKSVKQFIPISKYSPVIQDVNVTSTSSYGQLTKLIKSISPLIRQIELIDKYQSRLTLRIFFLDSQKQLTLEDVKPIREKIETLKI